MHGLEHATADVPKVDDDNIREFAESAQSLLKLQSQYVLYLHADVVCRQKTAAFQALALNMTEKEATGEELKPSVSLFDEKDFAQMEGTVKLRKEYQDLSRKLGDPNRKPGTGKKKFSKKKKWQSRDSDNTDERTGTSRQEEGEKKETPRQEAKTKFPRSTSSSNKGRGGKGK